MYQTPDGESRVEVRLHDETVWLSLDQMAELFQRNKSTISRHIKNVFEEGELNKEVVVAKYATTTQHGAIEGKTQTHEVDYYNLDMIISVGYRVHSYRGVQFRQWATAVLKEYIKKGFVLNDELLKNAGRGNYFDELLARIKVWERWLTYSPADTPACEFRMGGFTFNVPHLTLTNAKGEVRKLTSKEMELLYMLCEHTGETLERRHVLQTIWEEENRTNARSMDVYITKLRKYFKEDPDVDIVNVHGVGFKLVVK